ncbi:MAG: 50S ribosomal protein L6 [Bacteroidota bacterium]|nr:50S ribosomal protein L6 [Bacteroidota bacterium]
MSRIGKTPVDIPEGVKVDITKGNFVTVKGKQGEISQQLPHEVDIKQKDNQIIITRGNESKRMKSFHGLTRAILNNMVEGVTNKFEKKLEIIGVGYRAQVTGNKLDLFIGYSHPIVLLLPDEISIEVTQEKRKNAFITLKSVDKQLVGQVAAKIRSLRKPEPYKGKGIRYVGEYVRSKVGKAAAE